MNILITSEDIEHRKFIFNLITNAAEHLGQNCLEYARMADAEDETEGSPLTPKLFLDLLANEKAAREHEQPVDTVFIHGFDNMFRDASSTDRARLMEILGDASLIGTADVQVAPELYYGIFESLVQVRHVSEFGKMEANQHLSSKNILLVGGGADDLTALLGTLSDGFEAGGDEVFGIDEDGIGNIGLSPAEFLDFLDDRGAEYDSIFVNSFERLYAEMEEPDVVDLCKHLQNIQIIAAWDAATIEDVPDRLRECFGLQLHMLPLAGADESTAESDKEPVASE